MSRYYIAYGSNLNLDQMKKRCPNAIALGTASLKDYELLFKKSCSGFYLTIEPLKGSYVPIVIWQVNSDDESSLDHREGFPVWYYKKEIPVEYKAFQTGKIQYVNGFAYVMPKERDIGIPSEEYLEKCLKGYEAFHFDKQVLLDAYQKCKNIKEEL